MKFQRYVHRHTNQITLVTAVLIVIGLFGKLVHNENIYTGAFILASIIAAIPVMLRAWSALRYKTVSIELLVSIAVIGAFMIG